MQLGYQKAAWSVKHTNEIAGTTSLATFGTMLFELWAREFLTTCCGSRSERAIASVCFTLNLFVAKISYLNFHPLEVVSRYRDAQLQVGENDSHLFDLMPNIFTS